MAQNPKDYEDGTLRIKRPSNNATDERGNTVWVGKVETAELELVPTRRVRAIFASGDEDKIAEISTIGRTGSNGVLIEDCADGHFSVLDSESLDKLLEDPDAPVVREADNQGTVAGMTELDDDLELMNTRKLRRFLISAGKLDGAELEEIEGSDPYNSGNGTS